MIVASGIEANRSERAFLPCREGPPSQFYAMSSSIMYFDRDMHINHASNVQSLAQSSKIISIEHVTSVPELYPWEYRLEWQGRCSLVLCL